MKTGKLHPKRERGQALVETALSLMILIILLMGMVDFGLAFAHRIALTNASRAAARFASRFPDEGTAIAIVAVESLVGTVILPPNFDRATDPLPDELAVTVACEASTGANCANAKRGEPIRVTVTFDYTPLFGGVLGIGDLTIGSATVMHVMQAD